MCCITVFPHKQASDHSGSLTILASMYRIFLTSFDGSEIASEDSPMSKSYYFLDLSTTNKERECLVPLENNPEVFSFLPHDLGLSNPLEFYDVYSTDDLELLSLKPSLVHVLLLVVPLYGMQ